MGLHEEELQPLVDSWRSANPNIVALWWEVDRAVKEAVRDLTLTFTHGIVFRYERGFLFITLPSGRELAYVKPRIGENRFGGESVTYEGYGPSGVAVIVEALTNNRQRTAPEIRHYFDKYGGNLGAQGCVSWSFDRKGVIVINNEDEDLDEEIVMMDALEAGAEDFEADGAVFEVTTDPDAFAEVLAALEAKGYTFVGAEVEMVPQNYIQLTGEDEIRMMEKLLGMLEDNEDVQNVWHNWEQE
jgi:YebC/PmpR family DNA-binding regulatory protein